MLARLYHRHGKSSLSLPLLRSLSLLFQQPSDMFDFAQRVQSTPSIDANRPKEKMREMRRRSKGSTAHLTNDEATRGSSRSRMTSFTVAAAIASPLRLRSRTRQSYRVRFADRSSQDKPKSFAIRAWGRGRAPRRGIQERLKIHSFTALNIFHDEHRRSIALNKPTRRGRHFPFDESHARKEIPLSLLISLAPFSVSFFSFNCSFLND